MRAAAAACPSASCRRRSKRSPRSTSRLRARASATRSCAGARAGKRDASPARRPGAGGQYRACGAIVFEGWSSDLGAAEALAAGGGVKFAPNHDHGAVGPMTGITTRSMPLFVVENRAFGNRALCTINEGLGKVMRFGGNDAEVLARLAWLRDAFGPLLKKAVVASGGIALNPLIARGLTMGAEMDPSNVSCSSLLLRILSPHLSRAAGDSSSLVKAFEFMAGNDQFFLNVAMAMGKCMLDPAQGTAGSTLVTAMSRNGTDFGIRVAALGSRWFT